MSDVVTKSVQGNVTVVQCAGAPITMCDPATAAQLVIRLATERRSAGADVHLCNAYTLALADPRRQSSPAATASHLQLP